MWQTALIFERWTPFSHGSDLHEYGLFGLCSHKSSFKRGQTVPEQRYIIWLAAELEMVSDSLLRGEASWGLLTPSSRVKVPALRIKQPAYFLCRYLTLLHEWGQSIGPIKISMSALISNLPLKAFFFFYWWVDILKALWSPSTPAEADVVIILWKASCTISHIFFLGSFGWI